MDKKQSDKQTPKTFKSFEEFQDDYFDNNKVPMNVEDSWNAATEATRSEYDDKIKAMQAEIDKLRGFVDRFQIEYYPKNSARGLGLLYADIVESEIEHLQDYLEKLNQREGNDE